MGIHRYFSHIVQKYPSMIKRIHQIPQIDRLYLDCNSIIYDSYHAMSKDLSPIDFKESNLIQNVILKIKEYIQKIQPRKYIFIAFDGVAPLAKMQQQRCRRMKSVYESELKQQYNPQSTSSWKTLAITPGTPFMNTLMKEIHTSFGSLSTSHSAQIIISDSNEAGEGEHKLFQHIRDTMTIDTVSGFDNVSGSNNVSGVDTLSNDVSVIYGLDADLIMLSLIHLSYCPSIFVCREEPEFLNVLPPNTEVDQNNLMTMNIQQLSVKLADDMSHKKTTGHRRVPVNQNSPNRDPILDYIFICFLLGNDFLPHFPSLNIRTTGMEVLMDVYSKEIGNYPTRYLIDKPTKQIMWQNVHILFQALAKIEEKLYTNEMKYRKRFDTMKWEIDLEKQLNQVPVMFRGKEKYINAPEDGWQNRYYKALFHTSAEVREVSAKQYCEGLNWVFQYYTVGCSNWHWRYDYHYPPLLSDIIKTLTDNTFTTSNSTLVSQPYHSSLQLAYVIPIQYHSEYLPADICAFVKDNAYMFYPEVENLQFEWSFCRYFWEASVEMPNIPVVLLEKINRFICEKSSNSLHSLKKNVKSVVSVRRIKVV